MKIEITTTDGINFAEIISDTIEVKETPDAVDLIGNCLYQGGDNIIIHQSNIIPEFYDWKTGIAGEILQKFSNYRVNLAIVGDFSNITSKSLRDFIYESNKAGKIIFVENISIAKKMFIRKAQNAG